MEGVAIICCHRSTYAITKDLHRNWPGKNDGEDWPTRHNHLLDSYNVVCFGWKDLNLESV